ncbi:uncharacterized protein LOC141890705 isoform X2 [Acropora palmata]|uniref:uncharacterized protein LOC141890705 isoform X2 n=1 Tax=Acropora palmata TaxID=6131 RepID=UPI003DA07E52
MSFRSDVVFGKNHLLLKILAFVFVVCQDKQAVSGSQAGPDSSWPFDDLNANNIATHGNVEKTISPVGDGIYLHGPNESFVEIKNYRKECMENPSTCDITMGFFFKHRTHNKRVTYFGNKGNNDDLYRGINMHCKKEEHYKCYISVYGRTRYCHCRIYPFYGVWQYVGLIWEKAGSLTLYHDRSIVEAYKSNRCTCNKTGQLETGEYYLGKDTFPNAYFKDLDIWYSKQDKEVLYNRWAASFDNGGYTEITLKIDFWELAYNASKVSEWEKAFNDTINELYQNGEDFMEIKNTSISNSGGNVSVTFTMKFTQVRSWKSMLLLNLALENRTILGSYGVFNETGCSGEDHFICQVPKNHAPTGLHHNRIRIAMDSVETAVHEGYLYCYRVLYKKLDDPDTSWNARCHRRNPPGHPWIGGLTPYTNYTFRVMADSFQSAGLISESFNARTLQYKPVGPPQSFVAYNTSISSLHAQWEEVEESKHNGIMLGFKVTLLKFVDSRFQQVQSQTLDWVVLQTNFTGLHPFTRFKIEVCGFNAIGDGPVAAAEVWTEESYPSKPPDNFKVVHQGSTKLRASWNKVPKCCQLGIIRGYHVTLTDPSNASVHETRTTENLIQIFTNLKKFHLYNVSVVAFTSKGVGPMNFKLVSTDLDVPDAAPEIVSAYNLSQTEILVSWTPIPTDKENGIILQHKASFSAINGAHSGNKSFEANTSQGVIDGLYPFKEYAIRLSVSTIKGFGPISEVVHVTTEEAPPGLPPSKFHGVNSSSTSIVLSWDAIPPSQVAGILTSFYISYRQINTNDNTTYEIAVPITNLTYEITNLRKYTNYSLEIKGATKFRGINTQPIIISTDEDVPSLPPQNIEAQNSSSTKIFVQWNPIPTDFIHGILLGFKLLYRAASRDNSVVFRLRERRALEEDWSEFTNVTLSPNALSYELSSLNKFTNYTIVLVGFTSKGDGNFSQHFVVSTDEDIPSMPPSGFSPRSHSGAFSMNVTWSPVPDGFVHGILRGYRIYIWKTREVEGSSYSQTREITYGHNVHETVIKLLTNYASYNLEITAFTIKGEGPKSAIKAASTCKCPSVFKTTWYHFPPYISFDNGSVGGFIPQILELAVQKCCSDCKGPDGKSISIVDFELDGKGNKARKPGVNDFMSSIDSDTDLGVPLNGYKDQTHYSLYRYVKLAESPGVAFMTVMDKSDKAATIANMFLQAWPLLLVLLFMTLLAGVIMSFIEIGEGDLPKSYVHGAWEGFWWAFVTASTVGYGDRCASGVASRLFSIVWTLSGLIVLVILIGSIATTLTHFGHVGPYVTLYGTQVASITNNSEYRLGIRKNAKVNKVRDYLTYEKISEALANLEVKGVLVDLYVLSTHKHLFGDPRFRIVRVYDYKTSYGAVMAGQAMKLQHCFTKEIKENAADAFKSIDENVKILKEPDDSPGVQQSTELFESTSPKFITAATVVGSLLVLASVAGIVYEIRRDKSQEALMQSKDLKNELSKIVEEFHTNMKQMVQEMLKKHHRQQVQLIKAERERNKQAALAVNKYYEVLSLRDIRHNWSPKPDDSTGSVPRETRNPTVWPFSKKKTWTMPHRISSMKNEKAGGN